MCLHHEPNLSSIYFLRLPYVRPGHFTKYHDFQKKFKKLLCCFWIEGESFDYVLQSKGKILDKDCCPRVLRDFEVAMCVAVFEDSDD